jgi:hypothetical protein
MALIAPDSAEAIARSLVTILSVARPLLAAAPRYLVIQLSITGRQVIHSCGSSENSDHHPVSGYISMCFSANMSVCYSMTHRIFPRLRLDSACVD